MQTGVSLPGGEDGIDAERFCLRKRPEGIAAHVKGAVKGNGHAAGSCHKPFHGFRIQIPLRGKAADHDALRAGLAEGADIGLHYGQLLLAVEKITEAGTDENVDGKAGMTADLFIKGERRRDSADDKSGAQFQPVCAALRGIQRGFCGIHAAFQKIRRHSFPPW